MKVSQKLIDELSGQKYEDYQALRKNKFFWWNFFWWLTVSFFIVSGLLFTYFLFTRVVPDGGRCLVIIVVYLYLALLGVAFEGEIDSVYTKIFDFFYRKTNTQHKIEGLEYSFELIKKQIENEERLIEQKAITILAKIETDARKRLAENKTLNNSLYRKRNPDLYTYEIEKVKENYKLNQKTLSVFDENIEYIKFDVEKHKYFEGLQTDLRYEYRYFTGLLTGVGTSSVRKTAVNENTVNISAATKKIDSNNWKKRQSTKNWGFWKRNPKGADNSKPLGITDDSLISKTKTTESKNKPTSDEILGKSAKKNKTGKAPKENKAIELPESSVFKPSQISSQPKLDFENPNNSLKEIKELPIVKKKRMTYEGIIKPSPDFYRNMQDKKMAIGEKGELLAMEYERKRLKSEMKDNFAHELEHISNTQGDGFGYDIRSIENEAEIYIEVKTTTGTFNSNLFFTNRELEAMKKYDESYYLYRIFNFNEIENTGDFYIFRGKNKITEYFNFNPTVYKLEPKENI